MALESVRISEKITLYQDTFHCIIQFQGLTESPVKQLILYLRKPRQDVSLITLKSYSFHNERIKT